METNVIYNEDCLKTMASIPDNSIDLVVTSPPYNKGIYSNNNGGGDVWNSNKLNGRKIAYDTYSDSMPSDEYEKWQRKIITEIVRILKPSGSLFYNHKDVLYHNLTIAPTWVYDFKLHQQIIWDRCGGTTLDPHYFTQANEWFYWIIKDEKQFYFNKENTPFKTNIWKLPPDHGNPHPAPMALKMAKHIVQCCTQKDFIVYDPFMGSGTTALAALYCDCKYIGSEISNNYVALANKRIKEYCQEQTLF